MSTSLPTATLQDLHSVLEIYGADRMRWPAAVRLHLSQVIVSDPLAKQALDEAAALDRLLNKAPEVSVERERALASQIVASAFSQALVRFDSKLDSPVGAVIAMKPRSATAHKGFLHQAGAALLAASLVLGIFAGATGQLSSTFDVVAEALGLSDDEPELAFMPDQQVGGEEAL